MKLRELNIGDLMSVVCHLGSEDWDQIVKFGGARDIDAVIARGYNMPGKKWTFADDEDKAVVVGGYAPYRAGVYASWFLVDNAAWGTHGREITKMAAERTQFMLDSGAHRLETLCLASRKLAQRWYKSIGLRHESTAQGFCVDGSDAVLYVATRGKS